MSITRPRIGIGYFLTEAARDRRNVGAVAPSSTCLAKLLTTDVRQDPNARILEVGAGTGAVTSAIAKHLGPTGSLDVVESNPRFADYLNDSISTHKKYAPAMSRTRVLNLRAQDIPATNRYDYIVSGLPFANFDPDLVERIMGYYLFSLLRPGGTLSYFSYIGTRQFRATLSSSSSRARHTEVADILDRFHTAHGIRSATALFNIPPAQVRTLRAPKLAQR